MCGDLSVTYELVSRFSDIGRLYRCTYQNVPRYNPLTVFGLGAATIAVLLHITYTLLASASG